MLSKSNAHQYSYDDSHRKADSIDTKKNIDSTFTSSLPSHSFKSANLDNISEGDNSSSSAKSLASLDKEIAEKKAKKLSYTLDITSCLPKPNYKKASSKLKESVVPSDVEQSLQKQIKYMKDQ